MSIFSVVNLAPVYDLLTEFAGLDDFWGLFETAFERQYNSVVAQRFRERWLAGDFGELPAIEVLSEQVLGTANGAYASSTNRIYLRDEFVAGASEQGLAAVLLEEIGHFVDVKVNTFDSAGDEGAIFAALALGESLSESLLQVLKREDDSAVITLDGQAILVEQAAPSATFAYQDPFLRTLYTQGRYLYDSSGQKVILRGVNLPLLDDWSFPQSNKLTELAKTGANAVRIQWYKNYGNASRPSYSLQDLDNILTQSSSKGIIPILGLWDATCNPNTALLNTQLIPWWTSPGVVEVLKKHQQHLIINLANELGFYHWAGDSIASLNAYKAAYKSAITSIRQQNLHVPIMIDAPDCGTALDVFNSIGQELINYDPDHNLLLSAHAYWAGYNGIPALNTAIQSNLPIVFGEIANKQDEVINGVTQYGYYDLDGSNTNHPALNNFTYQSLLQTLKGQDVGWLSWSWWKDNLAVRQMTTTGNFANLTAYGNDLVNNTTYGLKTTAQLSKIFVTTFNGTNGNDSITGTTGDDAIYSLRGIDTINGGTGKDLLIIDYSNNSYIGSLPQGGITSSLVSNGSSGFNGSYKAYYSTASLDQVSFSNIERFLLIGTTADDNILTGDGDDFLYGGTGVDTLIGGAGNDYLEGGDGNDLIIGINPSGSNFGKGEIDTLIGGLGIDKFILGDTNWIGYDDGNIALAGGLDYAQITDFNPTDDIIQLHGFSSDYLLTVSGTNTNLYINKPETEPDELIAILQNRTGLSLTGSYFNYVSSPTLPTITLTISSTSVLEDGTLNLVYTFTRTGATTNALTVNYAIAGTTDSSDYTGATPGTGKTITFAVGSSTATLTIDPTADTNIEPDETVALTLTSGTDYTIDTIIAVTGTILNDDLANQPPTNLTLSNGAVSENQPTNTVVGNFSTTDPDIGDTFTYSLITGTGDSDNSLFTISNNQLQTNTVFNYEATNSYSIRVRTTDQGGLFFDQQFTINITDIAENAIIGTAANNTLNGTNNSDRIEGLDGNDKLYGLAGNDDLYGGAGNDTLDGGIGNDALFGGAGNDVYYIDNIGDKIIENANEGTDTVYSTLTYVLGNNLENLILQGTDPINGTGNDLNNSLIGNTAANILTGGLGNDTLNGGTGADTLIGGLGNDIYIVDNVGDVVTENLNEGTDTVQTSVTYTLGDNLENLTLTGSASINGIGNDLNNSITGNSANNLLDGGTGNDNLNGGLGSDTLIGGIGNDNLNGGLGSDTLIGGLGNDSYTVDNSGDSITESAEEGTDTVYSTVDYALGANLENLVLQGNTAINGIGNDLNNSITGNSANNLLDGGIGNDNLNGGIGSDTLIGGLGKDILTGGAGSDRFDYKTLTDSLLTNFDVITDFNANPGNDLLLVTTTRSGFTNAGAVTALTTTGIGAKLTAANFAANFAAQFAFGTRTFVAINDATAGFNATTDALIEVTGLTGTLSLNNFVTI